MCTRAAHAIPECRLGRRRSAPGSQASAQHDQIAQHTAYASAHQPQGSCNSNMTVLVSATVLQRL